MPRTLVNTLADLARLPLAEYVHAPQARAVVAHGQDYIPGLVAAGSKRRCYFWAATTALSSSLLEYCEGWVKPSADQLPIKHAWCVLPTGVVVDAPIAAEPRYDFASAEYRGIEIPKLRMIEIDRPGYAQLPFLTAMMDRGWL